MSSNLSNALFVSNNLSAWNANRSVQSFKSWARVTLDANSPNSSWNSTPHPNSSSLPDASQPNFSSLPDASHPFRDDQGSRFSMLSAQSDPISSSLQQASNNSLLQLYASRPNVPGSAHFAVIKITNVHWDTSLQDLQHLFKSSAISIGHAEPLFTHSFHLPLHHLTGRTSSECFIEFPTKQDAIKALHILSASGPAKMVHLVNGRHVVMRQSSQAELFRALFPTWDGKVLKDGSILPGETNQCPFIDRQHAFTLLNACKVKNHRKCRNGRQFENIISILTKVPWHYVNLISTIQRDHLFELAKLALESLVTIYNPTSNTASPSTIMENANIYASLLERLVRASLCVPLFSEKQKLMILSTAVQMKLFFKFLKTLWKNIECPYDLEKFVYIPLTTSSTAGSSSHTSSPLSTYQALADDCNDGNLQLSHNFRNDVRSNVGFLVPSSTSGSQLDVGHGNHHHLLAPLTPITTPEKTWTSSYSNCYSDDIVQDPLDSSLSFRRSAAVKSLQHTLASASSLGMAGQGIPSYHEMVALDAVAKQYEVPKSSAIEPRIKKLSADFKIRDYDESISDRHTRHLATKLQALTKKVKETKRQYDILLAEFDQTRISFHASLM